MAQRKLSRIVAGLALGALVISTGKSALADERTEARAHYKKGMADIANGRYDAGVEELKKAYDILPNGTVLFNIARAYVDMGDLENAVTFYKRYLEGNPPDRDEVAQIVSALESRIRKQQAELLEAQQGQTGGGGAQPGGAGAAGGGPGAGTQPGAGTTGPGAGAQPGGPGGGALAGGKGAKPGEGNFPPLPGAGLPSGGLKTEDVFEETVVTASKTAQSPLDAPNSTSIITEQDIRLSGITKIPELLRRLAGVDVMEATGSQTEVSLRGFNQRLSNKVLVLIDGRSVYVDLLGATLWSTLPIGVEDIERIEVVRGPGSALYGADAFNGVINIITKRPGEGGSGFNAGYGDHGTAHGTVWTSGREKEISYRLSAGYDYLPRWSREVPAGRADLHTSSDDQDVAQSTVRLSGTVERQFGKDITVGINGGYSNGFAEFLGVGPINDVDLNPFTTSNLTVYMHSKHVELRMFWNHLDGNNALNAAYLGQSVLPSRYDLNVLDGEAQYIDDFETGRNIDHDLHVGFNYRLKEVSWTYQQQDVTENHAGFFIHDEIKLGKRFALVGDYRADYVPYLNRIVQSPRGSLLFHPSDKSTVRAIVGTAFRTPTFLESYLGMPIQLPISGGDYYSQGVRPDNPNFKVNPEQVFTTELGYLNSESDYFTVDSAFFYNHADNLIDIAPLRSVAVGDIGTAVPTAPSDSTGLYPLFQGGFENQCQKYNVYGAELGARVFPADGVDFYANTTLMDVKQDNSGCTADQLALLVNDARTSAVKFNTGLQLRSKFGMDGSVDFHYVSPQDWAEQVEDVAKQRVDYQSFHLDAYTLLNASVGYRFLKNMADIRGVAFNLLGDQHREHPFGQVLDRRLMAFFTYKF